jgi:hypothetical protein
MQSAVLQGPQGLYTPPHSTCTPAYAVSCAAGSPGTVHPGGTLLPAGADCAGPLHPARDAEGVGDRLTLRPLSECHAAGEGAGLVAPAGARAGRPGACHPAQGRRACPEKAGIRTAVS